MPTSTDPRYRHVLSIYSAGHLNSFAKIFEIIPKTVVARDLGMNASTLGKKLLQPEHFTLDELRRIARLCNVPNAEVIDLAVAAAFGND